MKWGNPLLTWNYKMWKVKLKQHILVRLIELPGQRESGRHNLNLHFLPSCRAHSQGCLLSPLDTQYRKCKKNCLGKLENLSAEKAACKLNAYRTKLHASWILIGLNEAYAISFVMSWRFRNDRRDWHQDKLSQHCDVVDGDQESRYTFNTCIKISVIFFYIEVQRELHLKFLSNLIRGFASSQGLTANSTIFF